MSLSSKGSKKTFEWDTYSSISISEISISREETKEYLGWHGSLISIPSSKINLLSFS